MRDKKHHPHKNKSESNSDSFEPRISGPIRSSVSKAMDRAADIIDSAAEEEPVRHMQGIKTVEEALQLEDFPMTKQEVDYAVGDIDIEDGHGGYLPVYQITEKIQKTQFDSPEQVILELTRARRSFKRSAA